MLSKYVIHSSVERNNGLVDDRAICLHVAFYGDMQNLLTLAQTVHQDFFLSVEKNCFFEGNDDFRSFKKGEAFIKTLKKSLPKKREIGLNYKAYLKTDTFKNRLDLRCIEKEWDRKDLFEKCFEEEEEWKDERLSNTKLMIADVPDELKETLLVKELLRCREPGPPTSGFADMNCSFNCYQSWYQDNCYIASLDVKVRLFSAGEVIDELAKWERKWLMDIGSLLDGVTGYISVGDFEGDYSAPQMELFSDFPEKDVFIDGRKYLCSEWLMMDFTEGIEWANILNKKVADKLKFQPEEKVENEEETFELLRLTNGAVAINQKKDFSEYSPSDWEMFYPNFRGCLRPGYATDLDWDNLARNKFDIFVESTDFEIKQGKIIFSRGSFNFNAD